MWLIIQHHIEYSKSVTFGRSNFSKLIIDLKKFKKLCQLLYSLFFLLEEKGYSESNNTPLVRQQVARAIILANP